MLPFFRAKEKKIIHNRSSIPNLNSNHIISFDKSPTQKPHFQSFSILDDKQVRGRKREIADFKHIRSLFLHPL